MIQTFDFNSAGRQVDATGSFFRYELGGGLDGNPAIAVRADGQDVGIFLPGDSIELNGAAKVWEIRPRGASAFGTVEIGSARVQTSRLHGSVDTNPQGLARTLRHRAFCFSYFAQSAAGKVTEVQVWNPLLSGRAVVITSFQGRNDGSRPHVLQVIQTSAPDIFANAVSLLNGPFANSVGSTTEIRTWLTQRSAVNYGLPTIFNGSLGVNEGALFLDDPIVLMPGNGIVWTPENYGAGAVTIGATFKFREIPLTELYL